MPRYMRKVALVAVTLVACAGAERESGHDAAPTATAPLTADGFCDAYAAHWCDANEACACVADAGCVARMKKSCQVQLMDAKTEAALETQAMVFDGDRARAFIDTIDATACGDTFDTLGWSQRDLLDFGGVFSGTKQPGEVCSIPFFAAGPNECDGGVCVAAGDGYRCVAVADRGEACGLNTPRGEVRCLDLDAPVDSARLGGDRVFGPCVEGVCAEPLRDDMPCEADGWCASGRCDQIRRPTRFVVAHLDLDRFARPSDGTFDPADEDTFQYRLWVDVVDQHQAPRRMAVYMFRQTETDWGYSAMVDGEVVALGALAFDDDGALQIDYALTGGVSFEVTSELGPIELDFGDSVAEGGTGLDGTRLMDDTFGVRRLAGDQVVSTPFCAAPLPNGSACAFDGACASGACGGEGDRKVCLAADQPFGAACAADGDCASRVCVGGSCGAAWCR